MVNEYLCLSTSPLAWKRCRGIARLVPVYSFTGASNIENTYAWEVHEGPETLTPEECAEYMGVLSDYILRRYGLSTTDTVGTREHYGYYDQGETDESPPGYEGNRAHRRRFISQRRAT